METTKLWNYGELYGFIIANFREMPIFMIPYCYT